MANTKVTSRVIADNSVGITQLNVSDGSDGQVLTTNGSGTLSFTTISAGVAGISTSADATAITIDSSENVTFAQKVGIGVTPTHNFNLSSTGAVEARFTSTDNDCYLQIASDTDEGQDSVLQFLSGTSARGSITYDHNTTAADQNMIFKTGDNAVTAMTLTGTGNVTVGSNQDISMDANASGQLRIDGNGYVGAIALNSDAMHIYSNSSSRHLVFGTNETERIRITSSGDFKFNQGTGNLGNKYMVINAGTSNDGGFILQRDNTNQWQIVNGTTDGDLLFYSYGTSSTVLYVDRSNGHVGISNTSPTNLLTVGSSSFAGYPYRHANGTGAYYMGHGNSSYHHHEQSGASVGFYWGSAGYFNGGAHTYSDERLKENITNINGALDKVALMNGVTFDWKDQELRGSGKQFGVVAQNMLEVDTELPKLVEDANATQEDIDNEELDTKYYAMDYSRLTPYFIEAIKELKTKLEAAEARITELEG